MPRNANIVVGLDIGTTKTCAVVAEASDDKLDIIGIGTAPSEGLRKGVVVNIEKTVESIRKAITEAELMAACEIESVVASIAGAHVAGFNSNGLVAISGKEVGEDDVQRVIDAARAVSIPLDREVLHVLPQEYVVDGCDGVRDPVGMCGVRLDVRVHIVTAARAAIENIRRCTERAGLHIEGIVLGQLASAEGVLDADEKELGVAIVDIGGGTTDIAIYHNGAVVHTAVLPIGGNHVTNDIAVGLRTPRAEAEKIKLSHGCASTALVDDGETIEVPTVGGRPPQQRSRRLLCEIIEPRIEELFRLAREEIQRSGFEDLLASGAVITGGTASLAGMVALGEEVLDMPVRIGQPTGVGGLADVVRSPKYSTGVGLTVYGSGLASSHDVPAREVPPGVFRRAGRAVRDWFERVFL